MKIVVDTNIIFSAILNSNSTIGQIILTSEKHFQFYSCEYLKTELFHHRNKLLKLTGLTHEALDELELSIIKNITFINESLIPVETLITTENILIGIDVNDTPFVALTKHFETFLWTGDKKLIKGLADKDFIPILTTDEIVERKLWLESDFFASALAKAVKEFNILSTGRSKKKRQ